MFSRSRERKRVAVNLQYVGRLRYEIVDFLQKSSCGEAKLLIVQRGKLRPIDFCKRSLGHAVHENRQIQLHRQSRAAR